GLVDFFPPLSATAAPAPPPATTTAIATLAPADMPLRPSVGLGEVPDTGGLATVGAGGAVDAGTSVFASNATATLRHPPCATSAMEATFIVLVDGATPAVLEGVPRASIRLPTLAARFGPESSITS